MNPKETPVSSLKLSKRIKRILSTEIPLFSGGALPPLLTVGAILDQGEIGLLRRKGFGRRSLNEVIDVLDVMGLHLASPINASIASSERAARVNALNWLASHCAHESYCEVRHAKPCTCPFAPNYGVLYEFVHGVAAPR